MPSKERPIWQHTLTSMIQARFFSGTLMYAHEKISEKLWFQKKIWHYLNQLILIAQNSFGWAICCNLDIQARACIKLACRRLAERGGCATRRVFDFQDFLDYLHFMHLPLGSWKYDTLIIITHILILWQIDNLDLYSQSYGTAAAKSTTKIT